MADALVPPRRDLSIVDKDGRPTIRFAQYLERVGRDITNTTIEDTQIISNASEIATQSALINGLKERLDDLEANNDQEVLNSKITWLIANVNELINNLVEAVNNLDRRSSDVQIIDLQRAIYYQAKLLNERVESAFDTSIIEDDIKHDFK